MVVPAYDEQRIYFAPKEHEFALVFDAHRTMLPIQKVAQAIRMGTFYRSAVLLHETHIEVPIVR